MFVSTSANILLVLGRRRLARHGERAEREELDLLGECADSALEVAQHALVRAQRVLDRLVQPVTGGIDDEGRPAIVGRLRDGAELRSLTGGPR